MDCRRLLFLVTVLFGAVLCSPITDEEKSVLRNWLVKLEQEETNRQAETESSPPQQTDDDIEVPVNYPTIGSADTEGHKFWEELLRSLPAIKMYLENLDECILLAKEYQIIEDYFPTTEGDEDGIESSRVALCRFAFTLHRIYNSETEEEESVETPASTDSQPGTEAAKRGFKFVNFDQGPVGLKRSNGIFSDMYKRKFDPRRTITRRK